MYDIVKQLNLQDKFIPNLGVNDLLNYVGSSDNLKLSELPPFKYTIKFDITDDLYRETGQNKTDNTRL